MYEQGIGLTTYFALSAVIDFRSFENIPLRGGFIIVRIKAATVASRSPPPTVIDFNEGDFEHAAYSAHEQLGVASVENLNRMLKSSKNIETMIDREKIQMELIKLRGGERLLRLTEPQSGLSLEKKLHPDRPVIDQKKQLLSVFEAALARAELTRV